MLYNFKYFKLNKDMKANVDLFQCHKQTEPVYCTVIGTLGGLSIVMNINSQMYRKAPIMREG